MLKLMLLGNRMRTLMRPIAWALGFLIIASPLAARAQSWSGLLSPSRATDWSSPGVTGGIPNRTAICATLTPGATAAQINSAIAACPSGEVVFLNAGTYNLSSGITFGSKSNVTLRGAGADQTKLIFSNGMSCKGLPAAICIQADWIDPNGPPFLRQWTAGYAIGTTVITLDSTTGLTVGEILILDQLDDSSDGGAVFVCASSSCSEETGNSPGRPNRGQQQLVKVVAINGNNVTISPGLRMPNWRAGQSPGAFWNTPRISGDGVENLSMDVTDATGKNGIVILHASDCWVQGVRVVAPGRNHVWAYQSMRITVRNNYFYGGQGAGSQSYGFEPYSASDNLLENNIFQHVTAPITINGADTGSVYAYNFSIDDNYTASPSFMIRTINLHEVGISHDLFEGNDGLGFTHDHIHGTSHFATVFRNHFYGDIFNNPPKTDSTAIISIASYGRFFNIVGNVLGRTGYYTTYESDLTDTETAIFSLGWTRTPSPPTDALVKTTMMRWGNYDTVTGTSRFLGSEVPSDLTQHANPVPSNQSLPASFYLTAKPAWFGAVPWPAIGPDVAGGQETGGHAYKIPARLCWEQAPIDTVYGSANVRVFRPDQCYVSRPPNSPSNLVVR